MARLGPPGGRNDASDVAWCCVIAPVAVDNRGEMIRLAEAAVDPLGAAMYRVGRYDESLKFLRESAARNGGQGIPRDWAFMAMAHHGLGHRDEARRWLDRLRNHQPSTDLNQYWEELEIRLLRSEAEAVILYDPLFPADPFAH
jgi:hypothetical protein